MQGDRPPDSRNKMASFEAFHLCSAGTSCGNLVEMVCIRSRASSIRKSIAEQEEAAFAIIRIENGNYQRSDPIGFQFNHLAINSRILQLHNEYSILLLCSLIILSIYFCHKIIMVKSSHCAVNKQSRIMVQWAYLRMH